MASRWQVFGKAKASSLQVYCMSLESVWQDFGCDLQAIGKYLASNEQVNVEFGKM